jgi:ribonucleoside-diphosphate reductase alpha chain
MNKYPVEEIDHNTKLTRRIGLGIIIADPFFMLKVPYNSKEGYDFMNKLAEAISYYSMKKVLLCQDKGKITLFNKTEYVNGKIPVAGYYEIPKEMHSYDWDSLIEKIKKME